MTADEIGTDGLLLNDPSLRRLLRAATRQDDAALAAFRAWRRESRLDDVTGSGMLVLPSLVELVERHGEEDPDLNRMRGVSRYIWTANIFKLNLLFKALDALDAAGIRSVLLKSGAIFARSPSSARKRLPGDHDLLVEPDRIGEAAAALQRTGFMPQGFHWDDVRGPLPASGTAGIPLGVPGQNGEIDLHWRCLPALRDPALEAGILARSEAVPFHGRQVLIPSPAHHLFLALARCEPWDQEECFRRLVEGATVLAIPGLRMDWAALERLVRHYGLGELAAAYLATLAADGGVPIPASVSQAFARSRPSPAWRLRHLHPDRRSPMQDRILLRDDIRHRRAPPTTAVPSRLEAWLRQRNPGTPRSLAWIWRLASHRLSGPSTGRPRFLEGFSSPEDAGRWTGSRWAFCALPMADPEGGTLALRAHPFLGARKEVRILLHAGAGPEEWTLSRQDVVTLQFRARPLARLGGDALVALHLPDAASPKDAGLSLDTRLLGLFLHRV